jgi:CAAX protease family protein
MQPDPSSPESLEPAVTPALTARREPFWGYLDLVWMIGLLFAGMVVLFGAAAALLVLHPTLRDSGPFLLTIQFLFYGVVYVAFWVIFHFNYGKRVFASLGWRPSSFHLGIAALAGVALAFALQPVLTLLHAPEVKSPVEQFTKTPLSLVLIALTAVLAAPLFEELWFRGFLQPLLSRTFGTWAGIVITGILFGSMHIFEYSNAWQYGFAIALVGIALGYVRARSGSVIPSTVMHACFNFMSVIALLATKFAKHS